MNWIPIVVPTITVALLVIVFRKSYIAARVISSRRRRAREIQAIAKVQIPSGVRTPASFPDVAVLDAAQKASHQSAFENLGDFRAKAFVVCFLPPTSVLLLVLAIMIDSFSPLWAVGLTVAEFLCLGSLVLLMRNRNPNSNWVEDRMRAELLRREQYLFLALIGSDLGATESERIRQAGLRVDHFRHADPKTLLGHSGLHALTSGDRDGRVEVSPNVVSADFRDRVTSYGVYRIDKQCVWFSESQALNEQWEEWTSRLLYSSLFLAVGAAMSHIVMQTMEIGGLHPNHTLEIGVTLLAISLPPVCTALIAVRELFAFRLLSLLYLKTLTELSTYRRCIVDLESRIQKSPTISCEDLKRFQSIVLATENVLTNELLVWTHIVAREKYEVSA